MTLLEQIEAFLERNSMSATAFGQAAVNDPRFVHDLRQGRDPKMSTAAIIEKFIASNMQSLGDSASKAEAA